MVTGILGRGGNPRCIPAEEFPLKLQNRAENLGIFQENITEMLGRAEKTIIEDNMGDRDGWDLVGKVLESWSYDVLKKTVFFMLIYGVHRS